MFELFVVMVALVALYALPVTMAIERGRSATVWFCAALLFTPIFSILALLLLGQSRY